MDNIKKALKKRDYLESLGFDKWIILKLILKEVFWEGVEWIYLAQGRKC